MVTVTDNDRPPAIGIESARALEIAGEIVFPITLAGPSDHLVTVEWSTSDGTARANEDYRGATGMVNFPPGRTVENIRVILLDDMILEEEETFTVALGRAVNGTLGQSTATGVIAGRRRNRVQGVAHPLRADGGDSGGGSRSAND